MRYVTFWQLSPSGVPEYIGKVMEDFTVQPGNDVPDAVEELQRVLAECKREHLTLDDLPRRYAGTYFHASKVQSSVVASLEDAFKV
jgi:hypothetical protein